MKITAVIVAKNAANTLARCLKSVRFCDETVLVDMNSDDETKQIAKRHGARIYPYKDVGYADPARNFAISKVKTEWVLMIDADEEVSVGLKKQLQKTIKDKQAADIYYIPRNNQIFGKIMEKTGWWPDYQPKLFKKGKAKWRVGVHRMPDLSGKTSYLPADHNQALVHYNYQYLSQYLQRLDRYTSLRAKELQDQPESKLDRFTPQQAIVSFYDELIRRLFADQGIDEGMHGVSLSLLQANYQLVALLKQWERAGFPQDKQPANQTIKTLRKYQQDLNYWLADWQVKHTRGVTKLYWRLRRKLTF